MLHIEKKLLQNMEKIFVKKRRMAVAERERLIRRGNSAEQEYIHKYTY